MNILLRHALEEELNVVVPEVSTTHAFYDRRRFNASRKYCYPEWHWDMARNPLVIGALAPVLKGFLCHLEKVKEGRYHMWVMHTRFNVGDIR